MTREEKIQQYLDSKSRDDKLRDMRESMDDWDWGSIMEAAWGPIEESMDRLNDKELDDEYYEWFSYRFESDEDFDDDPDPKSFILDKCECDINQIARGDGHDENCPDRHA